MLAGGWQVLGNVVFQQTLFTECQVSVLMLYTACSDSWVTFLANQRKICNVSKQVKP